MKHLQRTVAVLAFLVLAGCGSQVGNFTLEDGSILNNGISTVNGRIDVGRECQVKGAISSVNGGVDIDADSTVGELSNVNGGIRLAENIEVDGGIENVNGRTVIGAGSRIKGDVTSVNGSVTAQESSVIDGRVVNVNGRIELSGARLSGIESYNGGIELLAGTRVEGPLVVKRSKGFQLEIGSPPKIIVGDGVHIEGPLEFEREVELYVHENASIGEVRGAEVQSFSGESP